MVNSKTRVSTETSSARGSVAGNVLSTIRVAPKANIIYVNSNNTLVSLQYAIEQNVAPVISMSYGDCEKNFSTQDLQVLVALGKQANAQGITVLSASGDSGAADC